MAESVRINGQKTARLEQQEARVVETVRRLLRQARDRRHTGKAILMIDFNSGGPLGQKAGLVTWVEEELNPS